MAIILDFPSLEKRIAEETAPMFNSVMHLVISDARRHLLQHYPQLEQKYGVDMVAVWGSFMLQYLAKVSYEQTVQTIGSEAQFVAYMEEISQARPV